MAISRQKEAQSREYALLLFRMTSMVLYSAQYHRQHCTLHVLEQFGAKPQWQNIRSDRNLNLVPPDYKPQSGGGHRVVVSTAAFHARVRGSVPGLSGLKETKMFLPHPRVKVSIVGSLRVWKTVSSQSSHYPQEVLLAQFSLYVHKGGLKPDSLHFISLSGESLLTIRRSYWCYIIVTDHW